MSDTALRITVPFGQLSEPSDGGSLQPIILELLVSDPDSLNELLQKVEGRERNDYALAALRIGLLSLRHARGQIDAEAVKHEGERLIADLKHALEQSRSEIHGDLTSALKEYFDPASGKFQERVDRLIRQDGELEQVLKRQIGSDGSELTATLTNHIGENSPLMKVLNPEEADGLVSAMRSAISEVVSAERERILSEFSLDNKQGALSRLIGELTEENGELKQGFAEEVQHVVAEFSLDKEDSALSRLVRRVEAAEETITKQFSLDEQDSALSRLSAVVSGAKDAIDANLTLDTDDSALSRLKNELVAILERHEEKVGAFQTSVQAALEAMKAQREEAALSTRHGDDFEDVVADFIQREVRKAGDIPSRTGTTVGAIKNCKKGDLVIELGSECVAAGERFVVEAKEDESYKLADARAEIEIGRKNREASVGLFVFSKKTCPDGMDILFRDGNDVFVVWDSDRIESDVILRAGLSLAKALCVRQAKERQAADGNWDNMDAAILGLEHEAKRLTDMKTWTETIRSNSGFGACLFVTFVLQMRSCARFQSPCRQRFAEIVQCHNFDMSEHPLQSYARVSKQAFSLLRRRSVNTFP
jgi:hypothetical protein